VTALEDLNFVGTVSANESANKPAAEGKS